MWTARLGVMWAVPIVAGLVLALAPSGAAAQGFDGSCVTCHTDAATLKALTPPDPPPSETGEG